MITAAEVFPRFPQFRDAHLLAEPTDGDRAQGRQHDEEYRHYQLYPFTYPGDINLREGDPLRAVSKEYIDFVRQVRRLGKCTSRLVVLPGRRDESRDREYEDLVRLAYQATHEAGEEIRIAWFGDIVPYLYERVGEHSPLMQDYIGGVADQTPRESLWAVYPHPHERNLGHTAAVLVGMMNYTRRGKRQFDKREFAGVAVYRSEFGRDLGRYIRALDDIYENPELSECLYENRAA